MEVLGHVLGVAKTIYDLCDQCSSNKKQCRRLKNRIRLLLLTPETLEKQMDKSAALLLVVEELLTTLENAKCWVVRYSQHAWWKQLIYAKGIREEFDTINDRLGDAATHIIALLAAEQRADIARHFTENARKKQNEKDIKEDLQELHTYLSSHNDVKEAVCDLKTTMAKISDVCLPRSWAVTEIRARDLRQGDLLVERPTHFLYRGELHRSPVAIKVFKDQNVQSEEFIRKTFQTESKTMKRFECANILRLYGMCIDNSGSEIRYSLVMDLCEKGTLREVLRAEPHLPWDRRVRMALDAARAMYRLHQSEAKAILHGNLSSAKYLVDATFCVKLSGFELSKTESSIRRPSNAEMRKKDIELQYIAPETWQDISAYTKRSEIYSLGVVMYEIATGKPPFHELAVTEDNLGAKQEQWWSSVDKDLPPSCPCTLRNLIKRLIQKDPKDRPSAGATVDLLLSYLNQQEPEICYADGLAHSGHADGTAHSGHADGTAHSGHKDGLAHSGHADRSANSGHKDGSAHSGHADGSAQSGYADGSAQSGYADGSAHSGQT